MRKPRLDDFQISGEAPNLSSPLDDMPAIEKPPSQTAMPQAQRGLQESPPSVPQAERADGSTPVSPPVRPYGRTGARRVITRYAFEFFQDQIERLRQRSLEQKLEGEDGSMSEMVRDALDSYLAGEEGSRS
jgi:hypothetical protein